LLQPIFAQHVCVCTRTHTHTHTHTHTARGAHSLTHGRAAILTHQRVSACVDGQFAVAPGAAPEVQRCRRRRSKKELRWDAHWCARGDGFDSPPHLPCIVSLQAEARDVEQDVENGRNAPPVASVPTGVHPPKRAFDVATLQRARRAQRSRRFQRWSKGAASRRKYNAREVWEREWPRGPRVFCPSGDPSFLARWRVCGRPAVRGPARRGRAPSNALPSFHNRRS